MKCKTLVEFSDFIKYGRGHLIPAEPVSLYRYNEHLLEIVVARKFGLRDALEIGPGLDPIFTYLDRSDYRSASIVDYNPIVIDHCRARCQGKDLEGVLLDIEKPNALASLGRRWDYVISNGVIEHLKDDVAHVRDMHRAMPDGGLLVCTTVLHENLLNEWDHAVGHYRRYSVDGLRALFADFSEVQIIQTSLIQELVRPLFFGRIRHLLKNTVEDNNRLFAENVSQFSAPPYAGMFRLLRYFFPLYLAVDWAQHRFCGAIVFVVARK